MYLFIKTDQSRASIGLVNAEAQVLEKLDWEADRKLSDTILIKIKEALLNQELSLNDLKGTIFYEGPGSFTGLRIGAAVANSLAYGLNVLAIGTSGDDWISEASQLLDSNKGQTIVVPKYGKPANITKPRK